MKIGFVVHFFDFRNDVRMLIKEVAKKHDVVLYVNKNHFSDVKNHNIEGTSVKLIDEKINSKRNKILHILYYFFKNLPASRNNFFLMETFKIEKIQNKIKKKYASIILKTIMVLPKLIKYDWYLNKLSYSKKTDLKDIDQMIFFTEISNDHLLSRCINEQIKTSVYVYSWDHPFKQTKFSNKVNYKTWSQSTKNDLVDLQKIDPNNIQILGSSQFGYIYDFQKNYNNSRTFKFKYIYYACAIGIDTLVKEEIKLIKKLNSIINKHASNLKLVVRPYPVLNDWSLYEILKNEGIIFDDNFRTTDLSVKNSNIQEKFEKIKNAELVLHIGTTFGLEASFFKTPSVIIDFGHNKFSKKKLSIKNFIHQGQNDKYLINICSNNVFSEEVDLSNWLDNYQKFGNKKNNFFNSKITSNFIIKSFSQISDEITHN